MNQTTIVSAETLASRFLSGYGLAERSIDECWASLSTFSFGAAVGMRLLETAADPQRALKHHSRLSWPETRHVLFAANDRVSVLINNCRNGSDYADYATYLPRHFQSRFARVVCREGREWSRGTERETLQFEARIFDLRDSEGEVVRSVACANDGGHWSFGTAGPLHPVENGFPYDARRKRDRFTATHLHQLVDAFGLQSVDADSFLSAERYFLIDFPVRQADYCSITEVDDPAYGYYRRGMGWVANMDTHASSVVADLERCVRINPDYEPRIRATLAVAHAVIGRS